MTAFFVHWNTIRRRVRVHLSQCGACKEGAGMHEGRIAAGRGETYDWIGAETYAEAREVVEALRRTKPILAQHRESVDCGLCKPARNSN